MAVERVSSASLSLRAVCPPTEREPLLAQLAEAPTSRPEPTPPRRPPYPIVELGELLEEWVRYRVIMQRWREATALEVEADGETRLQTSPSTDVDVPFSPADSQDQALAEGALLTDPRCSARVDLLA